MEVCVAWLKPESVEVDVGSTAVGLAVAGGKVNVGEACVRATGWLISCSTKPVTPAFARPLPIGGPPPPGILTDALSLHEAGAHTALDEVKLAVLVDEQLTLFTTWASNVNTCAAP